ncbi:hypothetical protein FOZ62_003592, partial [Perkinsus olseni]
FIVPALVANYFWGESIINGILLPGVLRYCFGLHVTWSINSVLHRWGPTPYDTDAVSAECGIVAFLALGDGWHNWHHTFQWDYAGAELSALKQFNPTKTFIDIMHYIGLAYNLRRANPRAWESLKTRKLRKLGPGYRVAEGIRGIPPFCYRTTSYVREDNYC